MRSPPSRLTAPQPARAGGVVTAPADRRAAWVQAILARPLFSPNRRPAATAAAAAGAAPAALPRVAGILVDGANRSVIFAAAAGGRPVVAAVGADVNGFKVTMIEANQVTVRGPDGERVLHPSFDANRIVPPPPQQAAGGLPGLPNLRLNGGGGLAGIPGLPIAPAAR